MVGFSVVAQAGTSIPASRAPLSPNAFAKPVCQAERWAGPVERELMQIHFGETPREKLVQIAWGESLQDPNNSVAPLVVFYLSSTETHGPLKDYYQSLGDELGAHKFTLRGMAARYPIRKGNAKTSRSLNELCTGYDRAMDAAPTFASVDYSKGPQR